MFESIPHSDLHRLLDEHLHLSPEYEGGFSNHLPMALTALTHMGASSARLTEFSTRYAKRLAAPSPTESQGVADDWTRHLGDAEAYGLLRRSFATAIATEGAEAVLRDALGWLISGVGAAAFHGVIRVAYATEAQHAGELSAALAYWATRWMPLPSPDPVPADVDGVNAWLNGLERNLLDHEPDWQSQANSIDERMLDASQTSTYLRQCGRLALDSKEAGTLLNELALAAAARYVGTRDFTVLHIATAARAARVLLPWMPKGESALAPMWNAVAAAAIASTPRSDSRRQVEPDAGAQWGQLKRLACKSDDEHVIKLVHAMAWQYASSPAPVWRQAAATALMEA